MSIVEKNPHPVTSAVWKITAPAHQGFLIYFSLSAETLGDADTSHGPMLMAELESRSVTKRVLQAAQPDCSVTSLSKGVSQVNSKHLFITSQKVQNET